MCVRTRFPRLILALFLYVKGLTILLYDLFISFYLIFLSAIVARAIIRNIDVGTYHAWNKGLDFYFILLTSSNRNKSAKLLRHYLDNPQEIVDRLPHRTDISKKIEKIADNLGLIIWNQLHRI